MWLSLSLSLLTEGNVIAGKEDGQDVALESEASSIEKTIPDSAVQEEHSGRVSYLM